VQDYGCKHIIYHPKLRFVQDRWSVLFMMGKWSTRRGKPLWLIF